MIHPKVPITPQELARILKAFFNESELYDLCFELEIDYESLSGGSKSDKARELVRHMGRHGQFSRLCNRVRELRPHVANIQSLGDFALKSLDNNDTRINDIKRLIEQLNMYFKQLSEWKELHNHLNGILIDFGQFTKRVRNRESNDNSDGLDSGLNISWQPINIRVELLLDWAKEIVYIGKPFQELDSGEKQGVIWAVKVNAHQQAINELLQDYSIITKSVSGTNKWRRMINLTPSKPVEIQEWWNEMQNATDNFDSELQIQMFKADKALRKTATDLLDMSKLI